MMMTAVVDGFVVETPSYWARFHQGPHPVIELRREGRRILTAPALSGLASLEQAEELTCPEIVSPAGGPVLELKARSNLWQGRWFRWTFHEDRIEHQHGAAGKVRPGRCYFLSSGPGQDRRPDECPAFACLIEAVTTFTPAFNMAGEHLRMPGVPQSLGILPELETPYAFGVPDRVAMIFAPPPLCLMVGEDDRWCGLGLGAAPGDYRFNALEYSGTARSEGVFHVNYLGYSEFPNGFASPTLAIHGGYSPYQALERHVAWLDGNGFATRHRFPNPTWHRRPVYCGWGDQCLLAERTGTPARDCCTQAHYETWTRLLDRRQLPAGTLVIDDKWQASYGSFQVDTAKWPDMKGFVDRQHAAGRHVICWIPTYHAEGLEPSLCAHDGTKAVAADVSHPAYETLLRERVAALVRDIGIDGFKVDWVWGVTRAPGLAQHGPLHGIEWLRRFQHILYDETHRWKPDALVETHSTHPLFRESSDVLRLNDLHRGARRVTEMMGLRARIARICGWDLVDCDSAPLQPVVEWRSYMEAQPVIGVPALYSVDPPGITDHDWECLRRTWADYQATLGC